MIDDHPLAASDNSEEKQQHGCKKTCSDGVCENKRQLPPFDFFQNRNAVDQLLKSPEGTSPAADDLIADTGKNNEEKKGDHL